MKKVVIRKAARKALYNRGVERIRQAHNLPANAQIIVWFKRVSRESNTVTYENPHSGSLYSEEEFELISSKSAVTIYTIEMNIDTK